MSLTLKLSLSMAAAICFVFGLNAALRVRREVGYFEEDMRRDHLALGRAVADATSLVWKTHGGALALEVVENADQREKGVDIRWVWLDQPDSVDWPRPLVPLAHLGEVLAGRELALRTTLERTGERALVSYVPSAIPGDRRGAIEIHESVADERGYLKRTIADAAVVWAVLICLCTALVVGLSSYFVTAPVRRLVAQAARIGRGDLGGRVEIRRQDEIGKLADAMNTMTARLLEARERITREAAVRIETLEQLRHADRLMTVGKLAAGIAHEIGTPLNVITGHAQLIIEECPEGSSPSLNAQIVTQQAKRVEVIIRQLLDFARRRTPERLAMELRPFLEQTVGLLEGLARKRGLGLELEVTEEPLMCAIDASQIQQAVANLIVNAVQASRQGTIRVIAGRRTVKPPADRGGEAARLAFVEVGDEGVGIADQDLPRLFEPFFTTKDVGEGTGLGLSVAYGIVQEHGGWIDVTSVVGRGSRFTIYLPLEATA